jgi:division protein CdvB (Snf7/Vps24/ESCRT-III family)
MTGFDKNWTANNQGQFGAAERLKESIRPQSPLKPRIETAINKLQLQTSKLDTMITKLNERDASLFRRIVDSMQKHDSESAKVLSNELAEVRKISKTLGNSKMALEQVSMRLSTIHDMGDAMMALGPAMASIKGIKPGLGRFVPGADAEINNVQNLLSGIMSDSMQGSGIGIELNTGGGSDIDQIMMEASAVAEQKVHDKFPNANPVEVRLSGAESQQ